MPGVFCVCESWLKNHITDAQIAIPNIEIIRQDRKGRSHGGVLLYVHNSLPSAVNPTKCLATSYIIFARNLFVFFVYCKQKVCLHFDIHSAAVQ